MEELLNNNKRIRKEASFTTHHSVHFSAQKHLIAKNRASTAHHTDQEPPPIQTTESPVHAMEFLCRSWSPSASNLLKLFPSTNPLLTLSDGGRIQDRQDQQEETPKHPEESYRGLTINNTNSKMNLNHEKGWLKGKLLTRFFRSSKEKKRDEVRFHTAKRHAALSLTQLAAAIAGYATTTSKEAQNINPKGNGEAKTTNNGMCSVVASAAALMTIVCAEAAESLGADRAQVASAVNSGLAINNPIDMIAVTATTSTCSLRGAAILKSRTLAESLPRIQGMLRSSTQICIITPSGRREYQSATIYSKPKHITICVKKKYFGGTLSTSKEYKLICIEEAMEGEGYFVLSLKTNNGIIKLLFEDQTQVNIWISTISNLLKMHNSDYSSET